jgi:cell division protein FtsW
MAQRLKPDWVLFAAVLLMSFFGLVIVYSASSVMAELRFRSSWFFVGRQAGWLAGSFLLFMFLRRIDYRKLRTPAWAFAPIGIVMVMLIVVYLLDSKSHRWLRLGPLSMQPSELAKPALILFLAFIIAARGARAINDRHTLIPVGCVVAMLSLAVVLADLGTAMVLMATAAVMFFVAGLERRYIIAGALGLVMFAGIAVAARPYRLLRLLGFVDPNGAIMEIVDPAGKVKSYAQTSLATHDASYQARQSRIAVGAGGVFGRGLGGGIQKLLYLPEAHTDFIYAVVGEELGLWGASAVLIGFVVILWRGLRLFWLASDPFGRYLALGITVAIVVQALINMSVVLDLGPTKGIPLPMISSGGSSLLSTLASLGLLLSISQHSQVDQTV